MLPPSIAALVLAVGSTGPAEGEASGSASFSASTSGSVEADADGDAETRPMRKWAPERNMFELGIWLGILIPNGRHEFYDPRVTGHVELKPVAFDVGVRFGYYPLRWLGGEVEGGVMPTRTEADARATMYTVRGHLVGQLPWWRLTPFLVVGGGGMGVASGGGALADDIDASFHWGPGLKFFVNRYLALRLDLRHLVGARVGLHEGATSHGEVLFGISLTLGRKKDKDKKKKGDDPDGDGFYGSDDKCPNEPGIKPDGCPHPDADGDGIADTVDECPDDPETANGFEDDDGCPDEVPKKLRGAVGVMPGITFETNSARVAKQSKPTLDDTVATLKANPEYDVEIVGHTDDTGSREHNVSLSKRRADSVADYLAKNGVERSRITTRGAGPDEPVADNSTPEGRAQNRRIEFKVKKRRGRRRDGGE